MGARVSQECESGYEAGDGRALGLDFHLGVLRGVLMGTLMEGEEE